MQHPFYKECDELCFKSKNLYNSGLYAVRQHFFNEKRIKTNLKKYGVEHPMYNEIIKNKSRDAVFEKFGTYGVQDVDWIREKTIKTNNEKYGVDYPAQNPDIYRKNKETNLERYGNEHVGKSKTIRDKINKTNLERYGNSNLFEVKSVLDKISKTNLERYGCENVLNYEPIKLKRNNTMLKRYGVESMFSIKGFKQLYNPKHSKKELEVCEKLGGELGFIYNGKEYDIKLGNNLFEIDGDYFHTDKLTNLNLPKLSSCINDFKKIKDIEQSPYTLYKIFISNLPKEITVENLIKNSYVPNFELNYEDVIVSKEYLVKYVNNNKPDKVLKYIRVFIKFIKLFLPNIYEKSKKSILEKSIKNIIGVNDKNYILDFSIKNVVEEIEKIKTDN